MKLKEFWAKIDFKRARWTTNNIGMWKAGYKDGFERGRAEALKLTEISEVSKLGENDKAWFSLGDGIGRIYCEPEFLESIGREDLLG